MSSLAHDQGDVNGYTHENYKKTAAVAIPALQQLPV
jgi:hypothetical protein